MLASIARSDSAPRSWSHDHVDQSWAPVLHHAQRATQRRPDGRRRLDLPLRVDAEALGEPREVRRGVVDTDADDLVLDRPPARLGHDLLVLLVDLPYVRLLNITVSSGRR